MIYGEHLHAEEVEVQCRCGVVATVEVFDKHKRLCGWFCRSCSHRKRAELRQQEKKITRAIARKRI